MFYQTLCKKKYFESNYFVESIMLNDITLNIFPWFEFCVQKEVIKIYFENDIKAYIKPLYIILKFQIKKCLEKYIGRF